MIMEKKKMTTASGRPVADNQNVQTAGRPGPMLLQDPWFLEKLSHFDREVIPNGVCMPRVRALTVRSP